MTRGGKYRAVAEFVKNYVLNHPNMNKLLPNLSNIWVLYTYNFPHFYKSMNDEQKQLSQSLPYYILGYMVINKNNLNTDTVHFIDFINTRIRGHNFAKQMIKSYERLQKHIYVLPEEIKYGSVGFWAKFFRQKYKIDTFDGLNQFAENLQIIDKIQWQHLQHTLDKERYKMFAHYHKAIKQPYIELKTFLNNKLYPMCYALEVQGNPFPHEIQHLIESNCNMTRWHIPTSQNVQKYWTNNLISESDRMDRAYDENTFDMHQEHTQWCSIIRNLSDSIFRCWNKGARVRKEFLLISELSVFNDTDILIAEYEESLMKLRVNLEKLKMVNGLKFAEENLNTIKQTYKAMKQTIYKRKLSLCMDEDKKLDQYYVDVSQYISESSQQFIRNIKQNGVCRIDWSVLDENLLPNLNIICVEVVKSFLF
eukprot:258647_1